MAILAPIVLLLLLGGAAVLGLIVFAIVHKRPALLFAVGGVALLLLFVVPLIIFLSLRTVPHVAIESPAPNWAGGPMNDAARAAAQELQNFNVSVGTQNEIAKNSWGVSFRGVAVLVLIGVLIAVIVRRVVMPRRGFGPHYLLYALCLIAVGGFFFLGSVRYQSSRTYDQAATEANALMAAAQHRAVIAQQQAQRQARAQQQVAQKDFLAEQQRAQQEFQADLQHSQEDFRNQMDKVDAPRIALPPVPNAPTATKTAPTAKNANGSKESAESGGQQSEATPKNGQSAKQANDSSRKHKKPTKPPAVGNTKADQAVVKSSPTKTSSDKKEQPAEPKKESTVAVENVDKPAGPRPEWTKVTPGRMGDNPRELIETEEYQSADECYQAADVYLLLKTFQRMQQVVKLPSIDDSWHPSITFQQGLMLADGKIIATGGPHAKWPHPTWPDPVVNRYRTTETDGNPTWWDPRLAQLSNMGIGIDYVRRSLVAKGPNNQPLEYVDTVNHDSIGQMKKLYLQIEFTKTFDQQLVRLWEGHRRAERLAMIGVGAGSILGLLTLVFALLKIDTWTKGYYTKRLFLGVPAAIIGGLLLMSLFIVRL
jgi:hypothetical protein